MGGLQFRKNDSRLTTIEEDLHLRGMIMFS